MTGADDDVKARFREALDKKEQAEGDHPTEEGAVHDGSEKSHGAGESVDASEFHPQTGHHGDR